MLEYADPSLALQPTPSTTMYDAALLAGGANLSSFGGDAGMLELSSEQSEDDASPMLFEPVSAGPGPSELIKDDDSSNESTGDGVEPNPNEDFEETDGYILVTAPALSPAPLPTDWVMHDDGGTNDAGGGSGSTAGQGGTGDAAGHDVTIDMHRALTSVEQDAIDWLVKVIIPKFTTLVNTSDYQTMAYTDSNGHTTIGFEVADRWQLTDFKITDKNYEEVNRGAGQTWASIGNYDVLMEVNVSHFVEYMGNLTADGVFYGETESALAYLAHEMGHATDWGVWENDSFYKYATDGDKTMTNAEWLKNEQYAWSAGRAILEAAGMASNYKPEQGFGGEFKVSDLYD